MALADLEQADERPGGRGHDECGDGDGDHCSVRVRGRVGVRVV